MIAEMNPVRFATAADIRCTGPAAETAAQIVTERSARKVLLLTDANIAASGSAAELSGAIEAAGAAVTLCSEVIPEPPATQVTELQRRFGGHRFDLVIGLGGGSVIDVAKLLAVLIDRDFGIDQIVGTDLVPTSGIPMVAVPTTAGTGAEVTPNAIVTLRDKQLKVGVVSRRTLPAHVILDAELTVGMPPIVTASTGIDAFIHSFESVTSNKANELCDAVGYHSMRLIHRALPIAYREPKNLTARRQMLFGSMLGGMALTAAGTTAVHALSYPLGGRFGVPHGIANAMLLVPVMEFNIEALVPQFAAIATALEIAPAQMSEGERAKLMLQELRKMVAEVKIPTDLHAYGVGEQDLTTLTEAALQVTRLLGNNRRKLEGKEIRAIYDRAFYG